MKLKLKLYCPECEHTTDTITDLLDTPGSVMTNLCDDICACTYCGKPAPGVIKVALMLGDEQVDLPIFRGPVEVLSLHYYANDCESCAYSSCPIAADICSDECPCHKKGTGCICVSRPASLEDEHCPGYKPK